MLYIKFPFESISKLNCISNINIIFIIKNEIKKIYDVRSRIVHDGNTRLNEYDLAFYSKLEEYLHKSLSKEIEALPEV